MELIACVLVAAAAGIVFSGGGDDSGYFLVAFAIAVALIALAYIVLSILASQKGWFQ